MAQATLHQLFSKGQAQDIFDAVTYYYLLDMLDNGKYNKCKCFRGSWEDSHRYKKDYHKWFFKVYTSFQPRSITFIAM